MKCASQRAAKKDFVILAFSRTSNAIAETNQIMDLSGPGWTNVIQNVLEIRTKYVEEQVQCPYIRPGVSVKLIERSKKPFANHN